MVTIKRYNDTFVFRDSLNNVSYPIDKDGLIKFITDDLEELVICDRGGRRIYNTDTKLKGIEKELDVYEDSCGT